MAIAGHLSRTMLEHYSHMGAGVHQNVHQLEERESATSAKSLN